VCQHALLLQAHLSGGEWVELLSAEHPGIAEVKWCRNRFRPFLCIGPQVTHAVLLFPCNPDGARQPTHNDLPQAALPCANHVCAWRRPRAISPGLQWRFTLRYKGAFKVGGLFVKEVLCNCDDEWRSKRPCMGAQADVAPGKRDAEEFIEVHRVGVAQLRELLTSADMLLPSMTTSFLALDRLQTMGHL